MHLRGILWGFFRGFLVGFGLFWAGCSKQVVIYTSSTNNTVEFTMPAYPGLYLSFPVLCPNYKQLAATTNYTGILTSSYGYLIMGLA